jgi:hypothetical protein
MDDQKQPVIIKVLAPEECLILNWFLLLKSWYDNLVGKLCKFPTLQVKSLSEEL